MNLHDPVPQCDCDSLAMIDVGVVAWGYENALRYGVMDSWQTLDWVILHPGCVCGLMVDASPIRVEIMQFTREDGGVEE